MNENWIEACSVSDIAEGEMFQFERDGKWIVVYHVDGAFFATDNVCPHAFALLSDGWMEDGLIECPLHGALFDIKTGAVTRGPAECAVKTYQTQVRDGKILCAI